jgi:hypothetical protein
MGHLSEDWAGGVKQRGIKVQYFKVSKLKRGGMVELRKEVRMRIFILLVFIELSMSPALFAAGSGPSPRKRLLPPASDFRLTLQEDANSDLPLGPSCADEAAKTLTCRAFRVKLENVGTQTVQIAYAPCRSQVPVATETRRERGI